MKKLVIGICILFAVMNVMAESYLHEPSDTVWTKARITGNVELVSSYIYKGATWNDGLVFQPSITIEEWLPVNLSFWGNMDISEFGGRLEAGKFSEVDMTLSYPIPSKSVDTLIQYNEYWYPGSEEETERELAIKFTPSADWGIKPYIAPHYMIDGALAESWYIEAGFRAEAWSLILDTSVGWFDNRPCGCDGWSHYGISITKDLGKVYVGVGYVGQIDDDVLKDADGPGTYEVDWVGRVGYNF